MVRKSLLALIITLCAAACSSSKPSMPSFSGSKSGDSSAGLDVVSSRSTVRVMSYFNLVHKLSTVTGLGSDSEALKLAQSKSLSLGSYDFGAGVLPENKWTLDKMTSWLQVIDVVCREKSILASIQASGGDEAFLEKAYGRDVSSNDLKIIEFLNSKNLAADRRARLLCTSVLGSGEFVSL